jgi:hypothetical protein
MRIPIRIFFKWRIGIKNVLKGGKMQLLGLFRNFLNGGSESVAPMLQLRGRIFIQIQDRIGVGTQNSCRASR